MPKVVLETIANLKRVGYDENVLMDSLIRASIELESGNANFVRDMKTVSLVSQSKDDFSSRFKMLSDARYMQRGALGESDKCAHEMWAAGQRMHKDAFGESAPNLKVPKR